MKPLILFIALFNASLCFAQTPPVPAVDKSPMDMSYFPKDFPVTKVQNKTAESLIARLIYGRPQKNGRNLFGELVPYDEIWRLGANEATEIEFFKDVKINGKKVTKGRYTIYCIPTATTWTIIINKETDVWGAFKYDKKKDVARIEIKVTKLDTVVESFSAQFEKNPTGGFDLIFSWDTVRCALPIKL
jgi:hypothetical protein